MANPAVVTSTLSKLALCDLLLDTAVELGRFRRGLKFSQAPVERLAAALAYASKPFADAPQEGLIDPTFYESFERLFRIQRTDALESIDQLRAFVDEVVAELRPAENGEVSPESAKKVIDFCVGLHQELTREIEAESRFGPFHASFASSRSSTARVASRRPRQLSG